MTEKIINTALPLPESIQSDMKKLAAEDGRSLAQEMVWALKEFIKARKQPKPLRK